MRDRISIATIPTERRIRREARSVSMREQALALRQAGATYAAIGQVLGISLERARQIVKKAERLRDQPRWHDKLPARALNFLRNSELDSLPEIDAARAVARLSRRELLDMPNFGKNACAAVVDWLSRHGLKLQPPKSSRRLIYEHSTEPGAPKRERPSDSSDGPLAAGRNELEQRAWLYTPPAT